MNRITVDLGFAVLAAELYDKGTSTKEITIFLEEKETKEMLQDIAMVSLASKDAEALEPISGAVECLVWCDKDSEDYTHKFYIGMHGGDKAQ